MRNFNLSLIFVPSCGLILAILQKVFNKVKFHVTYGSTVIVLHCIDRLSVPMGSSFTANFSFEALTTSSLKSPNRSRIVDGYNFNIKSCNKD